MTTFYEVKYSLTHKWLHYYPYLRTISLNGNCLLQSDYTFKTLLCKSKQSLQSSNSNLSTFYLIQLFRWNLIGIFPLLKLKTKCEALYTFWWFTIFRHPMIWVKKLAQRYILYVSVYYILGSYIYTYF